MKMKSIPAKSAASNTYLKFNLSYNILNRELLIDNVRIIYINEEHYEPFYLWNEIENFTPSVYFHQQNENFSIVYLLNISESIYDNSFVVYVPHWLVYDENYLKSLVNKFKIASKKYSIKSYN